MNGDYLTVAGRIRREVRDVLRVVDRTESAWRKAQTETDDHYVDATALNLHSVYAGLERIFEQIANDVDRKLPAGANWHQELLRQMATEIPRVRPAVLGDESLERLDEYRRFRHLVRNAYTFNLKPELVGPLVRELRPTIEQVTRELHSFADFLEEVGAEA